MNMASVNGLREGDVDLICEVNAAALASRSLAEFEATVLPSVKTCFGLSVTSLSNRHASIAEMPDRVVFFGIDAEAQAKYQKYYRLLRNPVRQRVACPEAETYKGILDSQDVFEDSTVREERLYREFHGPQHMDRSLAVKLTDHGVNTAMLGLWRSRESRGFTAVDLLKIRCMAPVLTSVYARLTDQPTDGRLEWLTNILAPARLSSREIDVARIAAKGLSTKQIAIEMCLSRFTIQDHLKSIYRKLGVNNRAGLMRSILGFN
jgi:DNA-binding CsgD family transcriptional regulator